MARFVWGLKHRTLAGWVGLDGHPTRHERDAMPFTTFDRADAYRERELAEFADAYTIAPLPPIPSGK